jgi:hypothetical protein
MKHIYTEEQNLLTQDSNNNQWIFFWDDYVEHFDSEEEKSRK